MSNHSARIAGLAFAGLALVSGAAGAQGKGHGKGHGNEKAAHGNQAVRADRDERDDRDERGVRRNSDDRYNRDVYDVNGNRVYGNGAKVPPGLAKKPGQMPPGQYKKRYGTNEGADVLGAFTYTGTFEIQAAHYGAKSVLGLDISQNAVDQANRNAALNGLEKVVKFEAANAFDLLKQWAKEGEKKWDVVMLDPPAFTKSRASIQKAITGYKEINLRGMKLVKPGGFLVTSSCTNLVGPELFLQTIAMAAKDARRSIRQLTFQTQSSDHPIIWGMENTHYLKFLIVQVG